MQKLKVGIVGCGRISVMYRIAFQALRDQIEVVIAVDKDIERARDFAVEFGCAASDRFADALAVKPDVLHLCTPHFLHASMAVDALRAGINVLTEKPMAITLEEADHMIAMEQETGLALGVIFQSRYEAGVREMKRLIQEGTLGELRGAWSTMNWSRPPAYYQSDWKGRWDGEGGGVLIDQAIHTIDMVQWLVDSPVYSVHGHIDTRVLSMIEVEDVADAVIEFENGCRYSLFACNYNVRHAPIEFEIIGEKGSVRLIGDRAVICLDGQPEYTVEPEPAPDFAGEKYWGNFHRLQLADFYQSIREGKRPAIDAPDGRAALEIVLSVYRSSRERRRIILEHNTLKHEMSVSEN